MKDKAEILKVIRKYVDNAVTVEGDIDIKKSFNEYGINSLDIVEIVSRSMRELRIKIPRTELSNIKNIGGLVDTLYNYAEEKSSVTL